MGIDSSAAIFVGLPREEIENQDLIDDEILHICPPSYDGNNRSDAIAGFPVVQSRDYRAHEFDWDQAKVDKLKAKFKKETGQDAKVYLSPYIC